MMSTVMCSQSGSRLTNDAKGDGSVWHHFVSNLKMLPNGTVPNGSILKIVPNGTVPFGSILLILWGEVNL